MFVLREKNGGIAVPIMFYVYVLFSKYTIVNFIVNFDWIFTHQE